VVCAHPDLPAEAMNANTQNALLKNLEEPRLPQFFCSSPAARAPARDGASRCLKFALPFPPSDGPALAGRAGRQATRRTLPVPEVRRSPRSKPPTPTQMPAFIENLGNPGFDRLLSPNGSARPAVGPGWMAAALELRLLLAESQAGYVWSEHEEVISDTARHCDAADIAAICAGWRKPGSPAPAQREAVCRGPPAAVSAAGRSAVSEKTSRRRDWSIHIAIWIFRNSTARWTKCGRDARERRDARPVHQRQFRRFPKCWRLPRLTIILRDRRVHPTMRSE